MSVAIVFEATPLEEKRLQDHLTAHLGEISNQGFKEDPDTHEQFWSFSIKGAAFTFQESQTKFCCKIADKCWKIQNPGAFFRNVLKQIQDNIMTARNGLAGLDEALKASLKA